MNRSVMGHTIRPGEGHTRFCMNKKGMGHTKAEGNAPRCSLRLGNANTRKTDFRNQTPFLVGTGRDTLQIGHPFAVPN